MKFVGRQGGYGRTIIIQHGKKYSTLYAHLSRFAKNMKKGVRVKQGQRIGYVGKSGLASGPHLHYEFRVNNKRVNPETVRFPLAKQLLGKQKQLFITQAKPLLSQLELYSQANVKSPKNII